MAYYLCPHCAQQVDTDPDLSGGERQQYIEDCPVCCRPNRIDATYDSDDDEFAVSASAEV